MQKVRILKRERINTILSAIYDYPLIIVEAPMGFGKTTAVMNFLASEKNNALRIAFLNSSKSTAFFWNKFGDEMGKLDKKAADALKSLGLPADAPQADKIISILNSIEYDEKTVLVIDDYHLSHDMQLNKFILQIAAEKIENFHIVIITRDTTAINFNELLSKGMCFVISQQQLKFTECETRDYCLMMAGHISEDELKKISEYTDGWISLIYIILLGLKKGIPVGMNNTIDELIEDVLFNTYDRHIQHFLLKLSIMNNFTAKQAIFVTEDEKASEILKKLQKENAFIFYDEICKTYKIHNVLLDFLRTKQDFTAEELKQLYKRLGEWYLDRDDFITAYGYLNHAGDVERVLSHLDNPANIRNELTDFEGSEEMFKSISRELLYKYPIAYLQYIFISIIKGNDDTILAMSNRLDELEKVFESMEDIDDTYRNRIIAELLIIRKFTRFNYLEKSVAANDEILRRLNGKQSYIALRENEFTFGSPHLVYNYFRDEGRLKKTVQLIMENFIFYPRYANGCGTGCDYLALAEYAFETGDFETVELNNLKAIYKAKTKEQNSIIICANFNLIRFYIFQGKINKAIQMLKQLEEDITRINNPIYNTTIDMCKGYIYACLCAKEKIPYWLQTGNMTDAHFFYQGIAFNYIVFGKALVVSKKYVELEMMIESFEEHFSMFSNQLGFIHNNIFNSVAKYNLYGIEKGIPVLQDALSKAQSDDIIMPFAENGPHIFNMLKKISENSPENGYIKRVLHCCRQYNESLKGTQISKVSLSQREIEVLSLAADGLNREEIASRLFMSQGTVKTHLQNIYQKLEASGKISAIKIAQMNGLI